MDLFLFTVDASLARTAERAGVAGLVVDWERRDNPERQRGADTQINNDSPEDLARVRAAVQTRILCRIDSFGPDTAEQIEAAVECGADEVLLPMVRRPSAVERALRALDGRRGLGILVETPEAVACARELGCLPLSRVYVGLNDLAICRGARSIFTSLADGTIDEIRQFFSGEFGVAGATLPERGQPIPARLLIGEIARLGSTFTFLRRAFLADSGGAAVARGVPRVLDAFAAARGRTPEEVERDRREFLAAVRAAE